VVKLSFNGLCFEWVLVVYVLVDYFGTFQAEMWVDLRWCAPSDLCKLNTIFLKRLSSFQKLLYHVSNVFFACRKVWPYTKIFLWLWHVKIAWHKQTYIKIKDVVVWAEVLRNMGCIMHDTTEPNGKTLIEFTKEELLKLMERIPNVQAF
jgi:hypothetical protein